MILLFWHFSTFLWCGVLCSETLRSRGESPRHACMHEDMVPSTFAHCSFRCVHAIMAGMMAKGIEEIKQHQFFQEVDWTKAMQRKMTPPYFPRGPKASDMESKGTALSVIRDKHAAKEKQSGVADFDNSIFAEY